MWERQQSDLFFFCSLGKKMGVRERGGGGAAKRMFLNQQVFIYSIITSVGTKSLGSLNTIR